MGRTTGRGPLFYSAPRRTALVLPGHRRPAGYPDQWLALVGTIPGKSKPRYAHPWAEAGCVVGSVVELDRVGLRILPLHDWEHRTTRPRPGNHLAADGFLMDECRR